MTAFAHMLAAAGRFGTSHPPVVSNRRRRWRISPRLPRGRNWLGALFMLVSFFVMTGGIDPASASTTFPTNWQNRYPASQTDDNMIAGTGVACQMCHEKTGGGNTFTGYGYALRVEINDNGQTIDQALISVEGADSDGNGISNIDEINGNAQPGWKPGATNTIYRSNGGTKTTTQTPPAGVINLDPATGNNAPVAVADSYSVDEDGTLNEPAITGVLANDSDADLDSLDAVLDTDVSNGSLTLNLDGSFDYTPTGDFAGSDSFTYHAYDGTEDSNIVTVTITVNAVNDVPSFTAGANQAVNEDAGAQTVAGFATGMSPGGGADEAAQVLTFNVSTTNDPLFAVLPAIDATTGELTYTPAADANGSATINVTLSDDGGTANGGVDTSAVQNFTITVNAVNDAPSFTVGANQTVNENAGAQTVAGFATGISAGPADESGQVLTFDVTNDNNALFAVQPAIDETTGELTYTPATDTTGSATVDATLSDDGGTANGGADTSAPQNFTITVNAAGNIPPVAVADSYSVDEDGTLNEPAITGVLANDSDADLDSLEAVLDTDVSDGSLTLNLDGSFDYTPTADFNGSDSFTYHANDGTEDSNIVTVTITVNAVNDAPSFTVGPNQTVEENAGAQTVAGFATGISAGPADESGQVLTFDVTNDNNALFAVQPAIDETTGELTYTPATDTTGSATVDATLSDDGGTANGGVDTSAAQNFTITVNSAGNNAPVAVADSYSVDEDGTLNEPAITGVLANDSDADLDSLDAVLDTDVSNGSLTLNLDGSFDYTPTADFNGSDSFTYHANDGTEDSNIVTVTITVNAVNDAPSFTVGPNQTVEENAGAQTVAGFATGISAGPADESGQVLTFDVTNDNNALFAVQPAIDETTGELTYTPAADTTGSATVDVTLSDDGGTANGGADTSAPQNFTITVNAAGSNEPTVQVSNLDTLFVASRSMRITWTPGNGDGTIVTVRTVAGGDDPVDGIEYVADREYTLAPETSTNSENYVVYQAAGNRMEVYGLVQNTDYIIRAYAYGGSGAQTDYLQTSPPEITRNTNGPAMHNYDYGAECQDCHNNHGGAGFVPRGANADNTCRSCHNSEGEASGKLSFAMHTTPSYAADDVDCGSCHEVHLISPGGTNTTQSTNPNDSSTAYNLSFIRANVDKYITGAQTNPSDAVFHSSSDLAHEGLTNDGSPVTPAGLCQSCHTETSYHKFAGSTEAEQCHQGGSNDTCLTIPADVDCASCHKHDGNFAGEGGDCTSCHNGTQGARRNVVQEFTAAWGARSAHIAEGSLAASDCEVCHAQNVPAVHEHGLTGTDKQVTLYDADDHGTVYSLSAYGDPTATPAEAAAISDHCLSCHDSLGATAESSPTQPFTDSLPPPDIDSIWTNSSHGNDTVRDPVQDSGTQLTCMGDGQFGCHGSGHGSMKLDILTPHDSGPGTDNSLEREGFCLNCHISGGASNIDIDAQFNGLTNDWLTTGNNGGGSPINGRHDVMPADQAVSGGVVTCKNCHSPHADNDDYPAMLDPDDHQTVLGDYAPTNSYVTPVGDSPAYNFTYENGTNQNPVRPQGLGGGQTRTEPDYIDFCLTCHDGTTPAGVTMPAGMIDIASAYQVDHHGRINGGGAGQGYLKYPWNTNGATADPATPYAAFNCTNCHGPHGSENIYNLRESVTVAGVQMRVGGWEGDDIGNPRAPYDCSTPGDPATCSTTYILPPMDGRNINDSTGLQEDRYWGAWCSFCHQMEQHGQAEDNKCRQGHIHGGTNF